MVARLCVVSLGFALAGGCGCTSRITPGRSDAAPGQADAAPGQADAVPGQADAAAGASDAAPGAPDASAGAPDAHTLDAGPPPTVFGGSRPVTIQVPPSYDGVTPTPLVVALHGFFGDPEYVVGYFGLNSWFVANGFLLIAPDGTQNRDGSYYWNATDACCDYYDDNPGDSVYLAELIEDISATYAVDPARVYVIGHSNGGFMAHRLACDRADLIAAVISNAGATFAIPTDCAPSEPVSVLQIHGTADDVILAAGGSIQQGDTSVVSYPSAATTVANWASRNGCAAQSSAGANLELVPGIPGAETSVARHTGCPAGIDTELWMAAGGGHVLEFNAASMATMWVWLAAHGKN